MSSIYIQMEEEEIKYIDDLIRELRPERCLEWGSGASSVYFPKKHKYIKNWTAVEHDSRWLFSVLARMRRKNTVLRFRNEDNYTKIYGEWDLIIVDGIKRNECLARAKELGGIVLLHDYNREEYQIGVALYKNREVVVKDKDGERGLMKLWE